MIDTTVADYCPCCGQPREKADELWRMGLGLKGFVLSYGDKSVRLRPAYAKFLRSIMERGFASTELLRLRIGAEADSNLIRVYACHIRKLLASLTGGEVKINCVHSWGYELATDQIQRAAA